jgi:hypothetical protein
MNVSLLVDVTLPKVHSLDQLLFYPGRTCSKTEHGKLSRSIDGIATYVYSKNDKNWIRVCGVVQVEEATVPEPTATHQVFLCI